MRVKVGARVTLRARGKFGARVPLGVPFEVASVAQETVEVGHHWPHMRLLVRVRVRVRVRVMVRVRVRVRVRA